MAASMAALCGSSAAVADGPAVQAQLSPSNHALIITVSEYQRSPLPGVLTDRKLANELAHRFGVPPQNIVELSEQQVTREGLRQALASMNQAIMPGDKLYVYFSGHGARFFSKATNQCTESIVMQDMHVVTNTEFASMLKPLSTKTDKTIVMLDSCHSGGVAQASSRGIAGSQRPKYSAEASSPQCSVAVNLGSFSQERGIDLNTTDHNLVILAAARNNEVAWDTSKGGALTYNFGQCLGGGATDADHSGSLSMQELTACVQTRLDKSQEDSARQHATLVGNAALVPAFTDVTPGATASTPTMPTPPMPTPVAAPPAANALATLNDIYAQRDDRWGVQATLAQPSLKIGTNLTLSLSSQRDGYVYLFYQGTQPGSFYLLFPNQLDAGNAITANQTLQLPRQDWSVTALGPRGIDHILVMVTATARDFSSLALPAEYVSQAGPFEKIQTTAAAAQHISQIASLSASAGKDVCKGTGATRDLGVAKQCSNAFGASMINVEETD
jgi:Caspase domain/Domain of unknown function (DUF4384)